jgi:hypothetical protein
MPTTKKPTPEALREIGRQFLRAHAAHVAAINAEREAHFHLRAEETRFLDALREAPPTDAINGDIVAFTVDDFKTALYLADEYWDLPAHQPKIRIVNLVRL